MDDSQQASTALESAEYPKYWQSSEDLFPKLIQDAIKNGLPPNTSWTENEIVCPVAKGGCVLPTVQKEEDACFHWNTPFQRAVWLKRFEIAESLLKAGADVDIYNAFGRTALHEAVDRACQETAMFLLDHGANLAAPTLDAKVYWENEERFINGTGNLLSLHLALSGSHISIMTLLLDAGANSNHLSDGAYSYMDLAVLAQDRRATALFMHHRAEFGQRASSDDEEPSAEHKGNARSLLEFATSYNTVPPLELLPVFRYAMGQVDVAKHSEQTLGGAEKVIDDLFRQLYSIAGLEMKLSPKSLCHRCAEFQDQLRYYCETSEKDKIFPFRLHENQMELEQAASRGCSLCCLLADALDKAVSRVSNTQKSENDPKADAAVYVTMSLGEFWIDELTVSCCGAKKTMELGYLEHAAIVDSPSIPDGRNTSTDSDLAFSTAKMWLERCKSSPSHTGCQTFARTRESSTGARDYPARILNVGSDDTDPFLVERVDGSMSYATLCYCRGESTDELMTTKANIDDFKRAIPVATMPMLFRDAILTAKKLDIQYLWIDILCIIQDDPTDRRQENAKMDSILLGAELALSSTVAMDTSSSMFSPRPCRSACPVPLEAWQSKKTRRNWVKGELKSKAVFRDWLQDDMEFRGPVHTRAWTLQEQLLSSRMLYFGQGLLRWECLCASVTEPDPVQSLGRNGYMIEKADDVVDNKALIRGMSPQSMYTVQKADAPDRLSIYTAWQLQLQEYTRRELSNQSERISALSALAQYVAKQLDDEFIGGIWKGDHLFESLCWGIKTPSSGEPKLPSWTWVSVPGAVMFEYLERAGRYPESTARAELVSFDVVAEPTSLATGSISLKGKFYSLEKLEAHSWSFDKFLSQSLPDKSSDFEDSPDGGSSKDGASPKQAWDYSFSLSVDCENYAYCDTAGCQAFELLSFPRGPPYEGYGYPRWPNGRPPASVFLILKPVEQGSGKFRRIGVGHVELVDMSDVPQEQFPDIKGGVEQVITLV